MSEPKFLFLKLNGPTIWLTYFLWYYAGLWIIVPPKKEELIASIIAFVLFFGLYYDAYYKKGARAWFAIFAITLISLVMATYTASASIFFIYAVMIATQTQRGKTRIAWLAVGFIATVAPALTGHVSWYYSAGSLMFGPLSIAATAINSKLQDQTETLLRNRTEMRDLAITAERERIARDMHDTLGHLLSVMTAKADLALKLTDRDLGQARQEIQDIHLTGRQALKDVRNVIAGMENTTIANELGHARYLLETANIHIKISNQSPTLPPEHQHALGMIIREATTNVVKHSNASRCEISLTQERDNLLLQVKDNGVGVSFEPRAGLSSMRKRAEQLSGTLHISAQKPNETLLELRLPMDMRH